MALDTKVVGATSGAGADVDSTTKGMLAKLVAGSLARFFSENDDGTSTGAAEVRSPYTDRNRRLRVAPDTILDLETFNYAAQNTGKFSALSTTFAPSWTAANGHRSNPAGGVAGASGMTGGTYAMFPLIGTSALRAQFEASISAVMPTNTTIDFGFFLRAATTPYVPTDGAYFRITDSGIYGVVNYNATETVSGAFKVTSGGANLSLTATTKYRFELVVTERATEFWINDRLYAALATPDANPQPFASVALPVSWRHATVSAPSGAVSFDLSDYEVKLVGSGFARTLGESMNAALGTRQGLSGGTMGSLAKYTNSTNATAAVPTNTTAALGTGLGGEFWETDTLAVNTDGIIQSYQVPAGTVAVQGRRLKIRGVTIDSYVQTALTGGGYNAQWTLNVGHMGVSLATAESSAAKAPRRDTIGVQTVAAAAPALTVLARVQQTFQEPIYVNPGEFVAAAKKKVGTAPSAGVIAHSICFDYAWE